MEKADGQATNGIEVVSEVSASETLPRLIVWRDSRGGWAIEILGLAQVARAVGEDTFAAFVRCFMGADRLRAFRHFYQLNAEHVSTRSSAYLGNWLVILLSVAGTARELGKAIHAILRSEVVFSMRDRSVWRPLEETRKRWQGDDVLRQIRNQLGFHLGDLNRYTEGVARFAAGGSRVFLAGGDGLDWTSRALMFRLPWDVMLDGAEVAPEREMLRVLASVVEDSAKFEAHLNAAFAALLKARGVSVETRDVENAPFVGLAPEVVSATAAQHGAEAEDE